MHLKKNKLDPGCFLETNLTKEAVGKIKTKTKKSTELPVGSVAKENIARESTFSEA